MTFTVLSKKEITTDKVLKKVDKFLKNSRKGIDDTDNGRLNDDVRDVALLLVVTAAD
jgi:hypothetical protein